MLIEELYIVKDGTRRRLDIGKDSGITLKYVSNIFGDFSKVSASRSYTFKLPQTQNNRRVLDMPEDVRHICSLVGKRQSAEFYSNGIPLFKNGNLYLLKATSDTYECAFTWNVVQGLAELSADDLSLNELGDYISTPDYDYTNDDGERERDKMCYLGDFTTYSSYTTDRKQITGSLHKAGVNPYIKAFLYDDPSRGNYEEQVTSGGVPCFRVTGGQNSSPRLIKKGILTTENVSDDYLGKSNGLGNYIRFDCKHVTSAGLPAPVVPIPYILDAIKQIYGISIDFGGDSLCDKLCVPLISENCSEAVWKQNSVTFSLEKAAVNSQAIYVNNFSRHIGIRYNDFCSDATCEYRTDNYKSKPAIIRVRQEMRSGIGNEVTANYLRLRAVFEGWVIIMVEGVDVGDEEKCKPQIKIQSLKRGITQDNNTDGHEWYDVATLESEFEYRDLSTAPSGDPGKLKDYPCRYRIDTNILHGKDNVETDILFNETGVIDLRFEIVKNGGTVRAGDLQSSMSMYIRHDVISDERWINVFRNLPDISCNDLLKSLGFILARYPSEDSNGIITYHRYSDIEDNIKIGNIQDWSSRVLSDTSEKKNVEFLASGLNSNFSRKNYFLMKNDEVSDGGNEKKNKPKEDAFAHSYGTLTIEGDELGDYSTVIQLPFYGAFLSNGKMPQAETFHTQNLWTTNNGRTYSIEEAKPIIATIEPQPTRLISIAMNNGTPYVASDQAGQDYCTIVPWQFPKEMESDERYAFLAKVLKRPVIIEIQMALTEMDLYNLDFAKPVYIEKYNSYFGIIEIQRNSDGVSKVKLIKISS